MTLLQEIEERMVKEELESATGLILQVVTPCYRQFIGPFPKDTAEVYAAIERLSSEQSADEEPNIYEVHLLFPLSTTEIPVAGA